MCATYFRDLSKHFYRFFFFIPIFIEFVAYASEFIGRLNLPRTPSVNGISANVRPRRALCSSNHILATRRSDDNEFYA